ncbi:hypothetical protein COP1_046913 [Malus domestica]
MRWNPRSCFAMSLCTPSGLAPGEAEEPPVAPGADMLVHVALRHVLLICTGVAVLVVHYVFLSCFPLFVMRLHTLVPRRKISL